MSRHSGNLRHITITEVKPRPEDDDLSTFMKAVERTIADDKDIKVVTPYGAFLIHAIRIEAD